MPQLRAMLYDIRRDNAAKEGKTIPLLEDERQETQDKEIEAIWAKHSKRIEQERLKEFAKHGNR